MPPKASIPEVAELVMDARALSEALLEGDVQESRFRAGLILGNASLLGLSSVHKAALALVDRLGVSGEVPKNGYAKAVQDLSVKLDEVMAGLRS